MQPSLRTHCPASVPATMSAQLRAPASETQQQPTLGLTKIDDTDRAKARHLTRDDGRLNLDALNIAAEPAGPSSSTVVADQDGQQHSYSNLTSQSSEFDDEYFGVVVAEGLKMDGGCSDPAISETLGGGEGKLRAGICSVVE